jgi:membrane-bound lytic murein transglycosylase D
MMRTLGIISYCHNNVAAIRTERELVGLSPSLSVMVRACVLMATAACMAALSGCGSTAAIVKENLKDPPLLVNAFSRAVFLGKEKKKAPTPVVKESEYPDVPADDHNPRVRRFIREYAYNSRETMKQYLARAQTYLPMVKAMAGENGVPEDISYLFLLESGANPEARSPANALGMWQFMPDTARSYGLRVDSWVDERLDPKKSTKAAITYLKDLYGMFGCWRLALSAYNSGENKLNKVLCQEDADEYDAICSSRRLKRETKEFFPRFQAIAHIAKNPQKYGFAPLAEIVEEGKDELAPIEGSYSLETISECIGCKLRVLADMNPALVRNMTPPTGPPYPLRVPLGKRQIIAAKLKDVGPEPAENQVVHVVNKGDNLHRICQRYGIDKHKLAELNPDVNLRRRLRRGAKLVVPVEKVKSKKSARRSQRFTSSHEI